MYITIQKREVKSLPRKIKERAPQAEPYIYTCNLFNKKFYQIRYKGKIADRDPMFVYNIYLSHSQREGGKVIRKNWFLGSIYFWDLVDDYRRGREFSFNNRRWWIEEFTDLDELATKMYNAENNENWHCDFKADVDKMVDEKIRELWDKDNIIGIWKSTEDYRVWINSNIVNLTKEVDRLNAEEKAKEQSKSYQQYQYQQYSNNSSTLNYNTTTFKEDEKDIINEIVKAGYRALAKKYHPDSNENDTTDKMQQLNNLKDKLDKFICNM